jgi:hypothetical protein
VLSDTGRFDEVIGLPPYVLEETPQPNGTILRRGRGKAAGFTLEWEEKPYEWIHGQVSYALDWEPLTLMGYLFGTVARQADEVMGKRILEAVAFAEGARASPFDLIPPELPDGARERAAAYGQQGMETQGGTADEAAAYIAREAEIWKKVMADAGIRLE